MTDGVFVSYRRDDAAGHAGRLYDRLTARFGKDRVFIDVDSIDPGADFVDVIESTLADSAVVVVVIGPNWLRTTGDGQTSRLRDPEDFVHMEVRRSLELGKKMIPVLVEGAQMPLVDELPDDLKRLARRNALDVSDLRFHGDADRLADAIEKMLASSQTQALPALESTPDPPHEPDVRPVSARSTDAPKGVTRSGPFPAVMPRRRAARRPAPWRVLVAALALVAVLVVVVLMLRSGGGDGDYNVQVAGDQQWTDTGIDVGAGVRVTVAADGTVWHAPGEATATGPDGDPAPSLAQFSLVPGNHAALLARVAEGAPLIVGDGTSLTAGASGRLWLGINDVGPENNRGHFDATVTLSPASAGGG